MTSHRAAAPGLGGAVAIAAGLSLLAASCDGCDVGLLPIEQAGPVALWDAGEDAGHPSCGIACEDAGFEPDDGSSDAGPGDAGPGDAGRRNQCDNASATGIFLSAEEVTRHLNLEKYPFAPWGLDYLGFLRSYLGRVDGDDVLFLSMRRGELSDEARSYGSSSNLYRTLVLSGDADDATVIFDTTIANTYLNDPAVKGGLLAFYSNEPADAGHLASAFLLNRDGEIQYEFRLSGRDPVLHTPLYMDDGSILLTGATTGPAVLTLDGADVAVSGGHAEPDAIVAHLSADGVATIVDLGLSNSVARDVAKNAWAAGSGRALAVVQRTHLVLSEDVMATSEHIILSITPTGGVGWRASLSYPMDESGQAAAVPRSAPRFFVDRESDACAFVPFFDGPMRVQDAMGDVVDVGPDAPSWPRMSTAVLCFSAAGALTNARVVFPDWHEPSRGNSQTPAVRSDGHTWLFATLVGTATLQNGEQVTALGGVDTLALELDQSFELLSVSQLKAPGDVWATDVVIEEDTASLLVTSRSCWTAGDLVFAHPAEAEEHLRVLQLSLP